MNAPLFNEVKTRTQYRILEALAREIWQEHYTPLLGAEQVEYMLNLFQTETAMEHQMKNEGYLYYLLSHGKDFCGYCAVQPWSQEDSLFISKLYLHKNYRGQGLARKAVQWLSELACDKNLKRLVLYVHKRNSSLEFYKRIGFEIIEPVVTDIGEGYYMDDFRMEMKIG